MNKSIITYATLAILLAGCSAKSNFYQLSPMSYKGQKNIIKKDKIIAIAPVEVADYLDKPQIVTRLSKQKVILNELDRWAGAIDKNIQSVIKHNLTIKMPRYTILSKPLSEPINSKYTLYVYIDKFDGELQGDVVLLGRWSLVYEDENSFVKGKEFDYSLKAGDTLDSIISTESKLLEKLSSDIAKNIR